MELLLNNNENSKYYDEVLYIQSNYKKIVKNPKIKAKSLSNYALLLTTIPLCLLIIFGILFLLDKNFTLYLYADIFFAIITVIGIFYYILIKNTISKLKNEENSKKLIIEKEYVEIIISDVKTRLNISDILYIIINKYSICFIPKLSRNKIIAVNVTYKNEIINEFKKINEDNLIIDNANLYN